jgi:hypothetical protein
VKIPGYHLSNVACAWCGRFRYRHIRNKGFTARRCGYCGGRSLHNRHDGFIFTSKVVHETPNLFVGKYNDIVRRRWWR